MFFPFRPEKLLLSILFGLLLWPAPGLWAVTLELGREGEVLQHEVETPNSPKNGKTELPWNPSSPATPLPKIEPGVVPPIIAAIPELLAKFASLINTQATSLASNPHALLPLSSVLKTTTASVQTGVGTTEKTAQSDGTATIEAFLPTYNPATIEVRVVNADNTEVLFGGFSMLSWVRPNDKAKALVKFKGADQPDSMYLNALGDWSPNPQKYTFDVKAGQRVIFSISGNPEPASFVRVTSNAF